MCEMCVCRGTSAMYLQLRRRLWYALHEIPLDVRSILGKPRFVRSLDTDNRKTAERRAVILEQRWKREIEQARGAVVDPLEDDARYWQRVLREAPEEEKPVIIEMIADEAQTRVERAADHAGIIDYRDPRFDDVTAAANDDAARFYALATGKLTRIADAERVKRWVESIPAPISKAVPLASMVTDQRVIAN